MRIIVPIKQILDPAGFTVHRRLETVFISQETYIINPNDRNALETALQLKDVSGAEVIVLSLGEPRTDDALREALALGADRAFLVAVTPAEAFAEMDASVASLVLGRAIEKIGDQAVGNGYDLIITGQRALDTGASQIGPRLAEYLGLPQVLGVRQVTGLDNGELKARRNWENGLAEVEVGLPALLVVAPQANQPRYPHGARIMSAYREWEVTTWCLAEVGLTGEELSPLIGLQRKAFPPEQTVGELITGTPDEAAKELAQILQSWN